MRQDFGKNGSLLLFFKRLSILFLGKIMRIFFFNSHSLFYKASIYSLIGSVLFFSLSKSAFSDEILDAENLYWKCRNDGKEALFMCRQIYLEALDKFLEEVWMKFMKRHEISEDKRTLNGKNIIFEDVKESQKKWREYNKFTCRHLFDMYVFGTNGPNLFFTDCRAFVIKQRIEVLQRIFCAVENYTDCEKQWRIEEKPRKPNDKKVDANK